MSRAAADPVLAYAEDVVSGRVVAGRLVRLAAERHIRDLAEGAKRGLRWDLPAAMHAIEFFGWLRLEDGREFALLPFQQFIVGSLFGWMGPDGCRRFRTAYVEMGKGNGKSPLAGGVGLYGLVADGEPAAEVYSAATTREQASILFRDAKGMAQASPSIAGRLKIDLANIAHPASRSFFRPCSSEHRGLDGKRVHMALIDELHEHPTPLVADKMRAGTKTRKQALILEITNSGHDRDTVCWRHHDYSAQVLSGKVENDAWFAYVCTLDACAKHAGEGRTQPVEGCADCDDWRDEGVWPKANPGLVDILPLKYLREQVEEAKGMPSKEGITKRLNFCWWTEGETSWLPAELWARGAGPIDADALAGRPCFGGLDVASKTDVAAWVMAFPGWPEEGSYTLLCRFWLPRKMAQEREHAAGVPWSLWERAGLVTLTDGDGINLDLIEEQIKADAEAYQIEEVAVDPWNAAQITTHLQEHGIKVVDFAQNIRNYNEPSKEFELLLKQGRVRHGDNAVLTWMAGNVVVVTDASGNIRPVKPDHHSHKKVDGVVAAVMALGRAMLAPAEEWGVEVWG